MFRPSWDPITAVPGDNHSDVYCSCDNGLGPSEVFTLITGSIHETFEFSTVW